MRKSNPKLIVAELCEAWNEAAKQLDYEALKRIRKVATIAASDPQRVNLANLKLVKEGR